MAAKNTARKSTGGPKKPMSLATGRHSLLAKLDRSPSPTPEPELPPCKWTYVMVRLLDVGGKMACAALASSVSRLLKEHPDVYNLFDYVNLTKEAPHILAGLQKRDDDARVDVYIMIGMLVTEGTRCIYKNIIGREFDSYMAKSGMSLNLCKEQCLFIEESYDDSQPDKETMAAWCMAILRDCEDFEETGVSPI